MKRRTDLSRLTEKLLIQRARDILARNRLEVASMMPGPDKDAADSVLDWNESELDRAETDCEEKRDG